MKKVGKLFICFLAALALCPRPVRGAEAFGGTVYSDAYTVVSAETGQVLAEKNGDKQKFPASITKILTLAMAMEKCDGDTSIPVTVTEECVITDYSLSHIALQKDETVPLIDLLEGTVLLSANDAANAVAVYVSGSLAAFADDANAKLAALGCTGSHFVNPNGLPDPDHYTTAADMAKITCWALTVPGMEELLGSTSYTMPPTNLQSEQRLMGTDNLMLVTSKYVYEGAVAGKTGWTQEARHTMVVVTRRDGLTLVAVFLDSANKYDKYKDAHALLDYCYENYTAVTATAAAAGKQADLTDPEGNVTGILTVTRDISVPVAMAAGAAAQDVQADVQVLSSYPQGEEDPKVIFTDRISGDVVYTAHLPYTVAAVETAETVPVAGTITEETVPGLRKALPVIGGGLLALSLLFALADYTLRTPRKRKT